jgi:hypothetical protein
MIYYNDHPPAHVHVGPGGAAKIVIGEAGGPPVLISKRGLTRNSVLEAMEIVMRNRTRFNSDWRRIQGMRP